MRAEAEKARLEGLLRVDNCLTSQLTDFLPYAADRYRQLAGNLSHALQNNMAEAHECLKTLMGGVKLYPSAKGDYLEADVQYSVEGLVSLAVGEKLKADLVAGAGFSTVNISY